jgi:hypothetical protein
MRVACDNSEDHVRDELCVLGVHWTIQFTSKRTRVAPDNSEDYIRNESYLPGVH